MIAIAIISASTSLFAAQVYYSVGTAGASDLKNGSPTITISSGTATFNVAQPDDVGVGDEVTYNGGTKAYISARSGPTVYSVTTATGTVPADVTDVTVNSITRAFASLNAANTGSSDASHLNTTDLDTNNIQLNWACYNDGPMNDVFSTFIGVYITGWTTSATDYIRVFAPARPDEVGVSQRHTGVAGTGFRLVPSVSPASFFAGIYIEVPHVRLEGIEIVGTGITNAEEVDGIVALGLATAGSDLRFDRLLIHDLTNTTIDDTDASFVKGIAIQDGNLRLSNTIIYALNNVSTNASSMVMAVELNEPTATHYVHNNTFLNIKQTAGSGAAEANAFVDWSGNTTARNNFVGDVISTTGNENCYRLMTTESNNVSSDATAGGVGSVINQTAYATYFQNVTPGSEDLHLRNDSTTLWGTVGADLDADANLPITEDVDGQLRDASAPDIGADELNVKSVFYSVGVSPADFKNGSPMITIAGGIATLTTSQPDNVGLGDEITYNGGTRAYISRRLDSFNYAVTTATGTTPTPIGPVTVDAIRRAFNSLDAATTGSSNASHLNTSDLVTANVQLNWVCYNDGADTVSAAIQEPWTTGPSHYIRVFTPTAPSEVGVSQRHTGVAGTGYRLAPAEVAGVGTYRLLYLSTNNGYIRVEGLEIDGTNVTDGEWVQGIGIGDSSGTFQDVRVSHNLIYDITNSTIQDFDASDAWAINVQGADNTKIWNNVIYNITNVSTNAASDAKGIESNTAATTHYIYNNTLYNIRNTGSAGVAVGIEDDVGSTLHAKNNYVGLVDSPAGTELCFNGTFLSVSNNVSSDATAAGAGSQTGQSSYATYFANVTPGSEDFHLRADSNTLWGTVGADLDSDPNLSVTDDIDGQARHPSTPDIGADDTAAAAEMTIADHTVGQVGDAFTTTSPVTAVLFRFRMARTVATTVDNVRIQYTTGSVIDVDVTSGELWRDVNNDGAIDGGDFAIQTGVPGSGGQLVFSGIGEDPGAGTDYLVRATIANLVAGDTTTFSLGLADIDPQGGVLVSGATSNAVHIQDAGAGFGISGTVFEDVNGDGNLADAVAPAAAQVLLFRDGGDGQPDGVDDVFLSLTNTDPAGAYSFTSLPAATYWVAASSKTVSPNAGLNGGFNQGDVWPEQTYGVPGAWCDDGTGSPTELALSGPCFGGRVSTSSDDPSSLASAEHINRVVVSANVTNVDFGFSYVAMVNTLGGDAQDDDGSANRTVQGSFRQFIQNASAVSGANTLRFVPGGPTNATDGGGNDWWRITVTATLPAVTDAFTTIDGRAYSRVDGVTVLDPNPTLLGYAGTVGVGADGVGGTADELSLSGVAGPELEIVNDRATNVVRIGLDFQANSITLRRIATYGFGFDDLFQDANVRIGVDGGGTNFTGILLENNVIGSSAASFTDPGVADRTLVNDVAVFGADGGTAQNNLIGFAGRFGVFLSDTAVGWTVQGNEFRANALDNSSQDSLDMGNGTSGTTVSGNLFALSDGGGIDSYRGLGGNTIENNTFSLNGQVGSEPAGLRIFGTGTVIRYNDIDASVGPGILIVSDIGQQGSPSIQNRITKNRFSGNGSNAIDLLAFGGDASLGDGITLNDVATDAQAGNIGLDYPVIDSAVWIAGTTTVTGTTCANCDVEVYKASAGAGDTLSGIDYGEGAEFVGSTTADGLGSFSAAGITSLAPGDPVSVIAIDSLGNTSEFSGNVTVTNGVTLTLSDHTASQVGDRFVGASPVTDVLFRFRLTRSGTVTVSQLRVNFTTGGGVANGDVTAGELWVDVNNDGAIDGGDSLIQGAVSPVGGVLTFTTGFSPAPTGTGYLVRVTVANLITADTTTFSLTAADIDIVEGGVNEVGTISNAVHTQDGLKTVYYSVGTSGADFKNGAPNITIAGGVATLTTSQPANVGLGDEITYNGSTKAYVSGRTSGTVYTVTTATGNVPPDVAGATVNSIMRAFNSLTLAQAGSSDASHLNTTDLAASNVQLNWVGYNDAPMDDMVNVTGWTTGPTNYIRIFTPTAPNEVGTSQRHTGVAGTGFRLTPNANGGGTGRFNIVNLNTPYVRIQGIEIDGDGVTGSQYVRGINIYAGLTNVGDIRIDSSIIHDLHTTADGWSFEGSMGILDVQQAANTGPPLRISNNFIYDITNNQNVGHIAGIHVGSRGTSYVYNNTILNINNPGGGSSGGPAWGMYAKAWPNATGTATVIATNNFVGNVTAPQDPVHVCYGVMENSVLTQSYNVSSDATAAGTGSQINQTAYASYFVDVTGGSEDLHLLNDSVVLWGSNGADLDSDPNLPVTVDIDGESRDPSTPDIGADESAATPNYRSIGAYSTGDASVTASTTTVTFAGGASLPADVQAGDQITLNPGGGSEETLAIASRDSATQLTLAGPAASTHTSEPYLLFWRYSTGDATVAMGGTTVTFGGGASLPAKTGLGDRLVVGGETFHVLSRNSATEVTVANPAASAHTGAVYTLQRAYQTLQNWEDDRQGDLVAENRREVGLAYNDGPFDPPYESANSALVINGSTTDAGHYMRLTAAPGNRHNGTAGTGVIIDGLGVTKFGINDQDDYTHIDFLELARFKKASDSGFASLVNIGVNAAYSHLLIYDFQEPTATGEGIRVSATVGGWSFTLRNSIIYNGDRSGVRVDEATSSANVENVTVHGMESIGVAVGGGGGTLTVTNTISMDNGTSSFDAGSGTLIQSYNLSSDGTAAGTGSIINKLSVNQFVSTTPGSEDLHLKAGADAIDVGQDLSASFCCDIDAGTRVVPWDIGADDLAAVTAVELVELGARPLDGGVELHWKTGTEIDNLGFHLYRSTEENGGYERITTAIIPGLGSSPEGAAYVYRDSGLVNGTTYFYKLEDVETTGRTELHGPVPATPSADAGAPGPEDSEGESTEARLTFGNPSANRFEVLSWDKRGAVIELRTEGFYAEPLDDGSVLLDVPGFDRIRTEEGPAIPVHRPWTDAIAGIDVKLVDIEELERVRFSSLTPSGADTYEAIASTRGIVRASRRVRRAVLDQPGLFPTTAASILGTGYQGDVKKVQLELAPLRWDGEKGELLLSRRLVVRLAFRGRVGSETARGPRRGRQRPRRPRMERSALTRFATREAGLHAVRYERLFGSSRREYDTSDLRLTRLGKTVPIHVEPDPARFASGSTLYFLSPGPEANPYGNELVFDLEWSADAASMGVVEAKPTGPGIDAYRETLKLELNRYYQAGLLVKDHWFWDTVMSSSTNSYRFDVDTIAPSTESGHLKVILQGASDFPVSPDHHVRVYVNGVLVGEDFWEGKTARAIEAELLPGVLVEGTNTLELENVGDTGATYSMVFLDAIEVDYMRRPVTVTGTLDGTWTRSGAAVISGASARSYVLDVTDEASPLWLRGLSETAAQELTFRAEATRRYLVTTPQSILVPELRSPAREQLATSRDGVDYLVIGPAEFASAAEALLSLRRSQNLRARFVSIEEIQSEFGFGEPRPEALRDFLIHVYHEWPEPAVRYVVLLGDGTYDYKDYLETGVVNQVPPLMIQTSSLWTVSDPSFAMVNGEEQLPDIAIGRLPAKNVDELRAMVDKVLSYESGNAGLYSEPVVLVADNPDRAGDFVANAEDIGTLIPSSQRVDKLYLTQLGPGDTHNEILQELDEGVSVMSYIGHGGIHLWADERILTLDDVPLLGSQAQQPLFLTMNCLNGYFHFPYFDSLSEALVKADGKGAIAAFSPSGMSVDASAHLYHRALVNALFHGSYERLGDAVLAAQREYASSGAFPELLAIYHVLGDPALRLK